MRIRIFIKDKRKKKHLVCEDTDWGEVLFQDYKRTGKWSPFLASVAQWCSVNIKFVIAGKHFFPLANWLVNFKQCGPHACTMARYLMFPIFSAICTYKYQFLLWNILLKIYDKVEKNNFWTKWMFTLLWSHVYVGGPLKINFFLNMGLCI